MDLEQTLFKELQSLRLCSYAYDRNKHCFYDQQVNQSDALKMRDIVTIIDKLNEHNLPYQINDLKEISISPLP